MSTREAWIAMLDEEGHAIDTADDLFPVFEALVAEGLVRREGGR